MSHTTAPTPVSNLISMNMNPALESDFQGHVKRRPHVRQHKIVAVVVTVALSGLVYVGTGVLTAVSAAAVSSVGDPVTRAEVVSRLADWVARKPAYDATHGSYVWDVGHTRQYRPDCSGLVDMALHLNSDENTDAIASEPSRFDKIVVRGGDKTMVQPGDIFDDTIDGHAFMFQAWESDHVHFSYVNFGGGSGSAPPEPHTHETFSQPTVGFEPTGNYAVYRYRNIVDNPGVDAVYDSYGQYHVFSVNKDGILYQRIHNPTTGWENWEPLGGTVHGTPGVAYNNGQYFVFGIGGNGSLYEKQYYAGYWTPWTYVGGSNLTGGVEAVYAGGNIHVFTINAAGDLYQIIQYANGGFSSWQNLGGGVKGVPGVTYTGSRWDVFAVGGDGRMHQRTSSGGTWSNWQLINGTGSGSNLAGGVQALYVAGNYHVFAINNSGTFYQVINGNGWSNWQPLDNTVYGTPGVTQHDGRYDAFAVGGNGTIYQQTYDGTWHGWQPTVQGSNFS
jgi:hypothetical protein